MIHSIKKLIRWDPVKNEVLWESRGVSFESVLVAIEEGGLIDIIDHPNQTKYPRQKVLVVEIGKYIHLVPYVENESEVFLKTIIPSRNMTKKCIK